jgi:hypothetical protein
LTPMAWSEDSEAESVIPAASEERSGLLTH